MVDEQLFAHAPGQPGGLPGGAPGGFPGGSAGVGGASGANGGAGGVGGAGASGSMLSGISSLTAAGAGGMSVVSQITDVATRLKLAEERYANLSKRNQITEESMMVFEKDIKTELRVLTKQTVELRKHLAEINLKLDAISGEVGAVVQKHEFAAVEHYLDFWQPLTFITREEAKRLIRDAVLEREAERNAQSAAAREVERAVERDAERDAAKIAEQAAVTPMSKDKN